MDMKETPHMNLWMFLNACVYTPWPFLMRGRIVAYSWIFYPSEYSCGLWVIPNTNNVTPSLDFIPLGFSHYNTSLSHFHMDYIIDKYHHLWWRLTWKAMFNITWSFSPNSNLWIYISRILSPKPYLSPLEALSLGNHFFHHLNLQVATILLPWVTLLWRHIHDHTYLKFLANFS